MTGKRLLISSKPHIYPTFWNINKGSFQIEDEVVFAFLATALANPFLFALLRAAKGTSSEIGSGAIADFANHLFCFVNVIAVDRQAYMQRWRRQLRWILDFSSKRQKERQKVELPCSHSHPLSASSSFHLILCDRWLREKQAILTEHSEDNQCSRKWAINIKYLLQLSLEKENK